MLHKKFLWFTEEIVAKKTDPSPKSIQSFQQNFIFFASLLLRVWISKFYIVPLYNDECLILLTHSLAFLVLEGFFNHGPALVLSINYNDSTESFAEIPSPDHHPRSISQQSSSSSSSLRMNRTDSPESLCKHSQFEMSLIPTNSLAQFRMLAFCQISLSMKIRPLFTIILQLQQPRITVRKQSHWSQVYPRTSQRAFTQVNPLRPWWNLLLESSHNCTVWN